MVEILIHYSRTMDNQPLLSDLSLFCEAARRPTFAITASELGKSSALVSKRIAILERALGVRLFHRTTRQVAITEEGEVAYEWARKVLEAAQGLSENVSGRDVEPHGVLRITSTFRVGRRHLAPILSELAKRYPALEIWLEVTDHPVDLIREGVDIDIRIGEVTEPHFFAHRIVASKRILCAAPSYLDRYGCPGSLVELSQHHCLILRERDQTFGVWRLHGPNGIETVKAMGTMSTNNADIARIWAHAGQGVLLVSDRDVLESLESGELVQFLHEYWQPADVWAVTRMRLADSPKLRTCVRFLQEQLTCGPFALFRPTADRGG